MVDSSDRMIGNLQICDGEAMNLIWQDKIRILCIEDDPIDVWIIRNSLNKCEVNHVLDDANCLESGLSKLRNQKYDVVFSDLGLPGASGIEVVQKLRGEFPSAPLIVLTGLEDERVLMQALDSGAQDYLVKSDLGKADLQRVIRHAILRQQNYQMRHLLSQLSEHEKELSNKNEHLKELNLIFLSNKS